MSYWSNYYSVFVQGPKEGIIRMLNAAIRNVGTGNVIVDDDDIDTINRKSSEENEIHGLRVAILDLLDEQCLEDSIIQENKRAFDAQMKYHKDVLDGKVKFDSKENEEKAMSEAEVELESTCNGRFINLGMIHETESGLEVNMEFHLGEEESAPEWIGWGDVCRLYGCKIVVDNEEYEDGCFYHFYGTTIYEMKNGNVKETAIVPELNIYDYFSAYNKLISVNPDRYRNKKICDMEAMVRVLQAEISNERLLLQLQRLDETQGHLDVPEGVTHLSSVMWLYANKLRSIYIPASVDTINKHAISASSLESIEISPDNPYFCSENNCILNKEKTRLLIGCKGSVVPDGVEEIEDDAFSECCGLERITIPSHVKKVGKRAFCGCTGLSKLIVEEGVEQLGFASFQGCTSLTDVTLPKHLEDMAGDAFIEDDDAWINDVLS